jgi:excisionase family DNA binding protein
MPLPDVADWLTKAQAAELIGVSTKTIEAWAQAKKLQQAARPQAHGPALAVYHPEDVARLASERRAAPLAPFVVPGPTGGNGLSPKNVLASTESVRATAGAELLREFLGAFVHAVGATSQNSENATSESSQRSFVTIAEASAITGLTQAYLRRAIDDERLPAIKDRGWRIRRKDLEAL